MPQVSPLDIEPLLERQSRELRQGPSGWKQKVLKLFGLGGKDDDDDDESDASPEFRTLSSFSRKRFMSQTLALVSSQLAITAALSQAALNLEPLRNFFIGWWVGKTVVVVAGVGAFVLQILLKWAPKILKKRRLRATHCLVLFTTCQSIATAGSCALTTLLNKGKGPLDEWTTTPRPHNGVDWVPDKLQEGLESIPTSYSDVQKQVVSKLGKAIGFDPPVFSDDSPIIVRAACLVATGIACSVVLLLFMAILASVSPSSTLVSGGRFSGMKKRMMLSVGLGLVVFLGEAGGSLLADWKSTPAWLKVVLTILLSSGWEHQPLWASALAALGSGIFGTIMVTSTATALRKGEARILEAGEFEDDDNKYKYERAFAALVIYHEAIGGLKCAMGEKAVCCCC